MFGHLDGPGRIIIIEVLLNVNHYMHLVQDKKFYEALRKDKEMNKRKYAHVKRSKGRAKSTISPSKPLYDMDVEVRSPHIYDAAAGVGT